MKSKMIKIENCNFEEVQKIIWFAGFLSTLNIKNAEELEQDVHNEMCDSFCSECTSDLRYCECRKHDYHYEIDEDRLYDEWKDQQLMDED